MRFDLIRYLYTAKAPYSEKVQIDLSGYDFPGYRVEKPADAELDIEREDERLAISLQISCQAEGECARCLEATCRTFEFESEYLLKESEILCEEPELPIDSKGVLDVDELIYQEIVMNVPQVLLCSPDCKGLCPICGQKITAGHSCRPAEEKTHADPRLSILKQLLN